jgi:hypothetical protein
MATEQPTAGARPAIDVDRPVLPRPAAQALLAVLRDAVARGLLEHRPEDNPSLLGAWRGAAGGPISPKWNVKVYAYNAKKGGHSVVCVDRLVLRQLAAGDLPAIEAPPALPLLRIDDAGWGFPLCGVMVGVSDEREVRTAVVPVEYFRAEGPNRYATKRYLDVYAARALEVVRGFGATPETHRLEICTGYVNQPLREALRRLGFDVRVVEIRGLLQDVLEERFGAWVHEELGADLYYDPKAVAKAEIPRRYRACVEFGRRQRPDQLKTGWGGLGG